MRSRREIFLLHSSTAHLNQRRLQIALLAQPAVTSPIVGVTKAQHLKDAVAAVDLVLGDDELAELGAGYAPHSIAGHR